MRSRILGVAVFLISSAVASLAGGPAFVAGSGYNAGVEGQALIWATGTGSTSTVQYFTDQGNLSPILTGAQADALVATAFSTWTSIPGVALTASLGGHLAEDVNGSNIETNGYGVVTGPPTLQPQVRVLRSELCMTTTGRSQMQFWAKALATWRIALPTPFTADPTTSPQAGTSCTRWW